MSLVNKLILTLALLIGVASAAMAADPINTLERSGLAGYKPSGIAIRGFDKVAYFTEGDAVEGKASIAAKWKGAIWQFSKQEHLDLFKANPEMYAPQYGGYCAYGVAVDNLVKIEGDLWDIVNGKLYLNYNRRFQTKWEADTKNLIRIADSKFEALLLNSP